MITIMIMTMKKVNLWHNKRLSRGWSSPSEKFCCDCCCLPASSSSSSSASSWRCQKHDHDCHAGRNGWWCWWWLNIWKDAEWFPQCTTELPCTAVNISCEWNEDKNNDYNDYFGIDGENGTDKIFRNLRDWDWCSENIGFTFLHKSYFLAKKILWDWQEVWIALKMSTTSITKWFFSTPKEIYHFLSPHFVEK